jgi:hypothetical protein
MLGSHKAYWTLQNSKQGNSSHYQLTYPVQRTRRLPIRTATASSLGLATCYPEPGHPWFSLITPEKSQYNFNGWTTTDSFQTGSASIYWFTNHETPYHLAISITHKQASLRSAHNKQQLQYAQTVRRYLPLNTKRWPNNAISVLVCCVEQNSL